MDIRQSIMGIFKKDYDEFEKFAGTGFVAGDGVIVTCAHVVDAAKREDNTVSFQCEGESITRTAVIQAYDPKSNLDVAILHPADLPKTAVPLPLAVSEVSFGHKFSVFGYPQQGNFEGLYAIGIILGAVNDRKNHRYLQLTSFQVTHGYSGGPILDDDLQHVVGIVNSGLLLRFEKAHHGTSFAIPSETIHKVYPALKLVESAFFERPRDTKFERLNSMIIDHSTFMKSRLDSFVGRKLELQQIRQLISEKIPEGGYITITGEAGQGKSSIISKLIEEMGYEDSIYYFIPFNPGPDHQVVLLRSLIARLIQKYDLSDVYVMSDSRQVLQASFQKMLFELSGANKREIIFIDGLDQLQIDQNGERDLSFLPTYLHPGVVFVLGTRPNDTLKPLELLKPHNEYRLPKLGRDDFREILLKRGVTIQEDAADRLYAIMQANALYLDLVAKEISLDNVENVNNVIKRITANPDNIFSISISRLKKSEQQWEQVVRPLLGVLLTARRSLSRDLIANYLAVRVDILLGALQKLGGLVVQDERGRYYLYHLKFRDYLHQDLHDPNKDFVFSAAEEKLLHLNFADWCALTGQGLNLIWLDSENPVEQEKREYSREHYVSHLYLGENWREIWNTLALAEYGIEKLRWDPSTRSYANDLALGCQAVSHPSLSIEEKLPAIPNFWRWRLLQCSLTGKIRQYPPEMFTLLVLRNRKSEAVELIEFLPNPRAKVISLCTIAMALSCYSPQNNEAITLIDQALNYAISIPDKWEHREIYRVLLDSLIKIRQWDFAINIAYQFGDVRDRIMALAKIADELVLIGNIPKFTEVEEKYLRLCQLSGAKAEYITADVELVRKLKTNSHYKDEVIESALLERISALSIIKLFKGLISAGCAHDALILSFHLEKPQKLELAIPFARMLIENNLKNEALRFLDEILQTARSLDFPPYYLNSIALLLVSAQERERAIDLLSQVSIDYHIIDDSDARSLALIRLAEDAYQHKNEALARRILELARSISYLIEEPTKLSHILEKMADTYFKIGDAQRSTELYLQAGRAPLATIDYQEVDIRKRINELLESGNILQAIDLMLSSDFIASLVRDHKIEEALQEARDRQRPGKWRVNTYVVIIKELLRQKDSNSINLFWEEFIGEASNLTFDKDNVKLLSEICLVASELNRVDTTVYFARFATKIYVDETLSLYLEEKVDLLCSVSSSLARVNQWAYALFIISKLLPAIENSPLIEKPKLIMKIAKVQWECNDLENLFHVIYKSWLSAKTRQEMLDFMPVGAVLFYNMEDKLDIILDSFNWVDHILGQ